MPTLAPPQAGPILRQNPRKCLRGQPLGKLHEIELPGQIVVFCEVAQQVVADVDVNVFESIGLRMVRRTGRWL